MAIGVTEAGRVLRVIYSPDPDPQSVFVITAYELKGKPLAAYPASARPKETTMKPKTKNQFPPGWDEERVRRVLDHYENQSEDEDEAVAEDEAAFEPSA